MIVIPGVVIQSRIHESSASLVYRGIREADSCAIALQLAEEGADIVIDYRSHPDGAAETKTKVEAAGRKGHVVNSRSKRNRKYSQTDW